MTEKKLQAKMKYAGLKPDEPLIFDRTVDDVVARTKKGYYNLGDLQRIQAWIRYGAEMAEETFTEIPFTEGEAVTRERFEQALNDINGLIQKIYEGHDKTPPTMPIAIAWDWKKANEAERILQLATDFLYSSWNDSIFATATYANWEGYFYYHPQFLSPMHVFRREKPEKTEKPTCTFVLVSLSGKEIQYTVEINSWFMLPPYDEIFPNDGTITEWNEHERGKKRLDMAYVFVKSPDWGNGSGVYNAGGKYYFYAINRVQVQNALLNCNFKYTFNDDNTMDINITGIPEIIQRQFSSTTGRLEYRGFCIKWFRRQFNSKSCSENRQTIRYYGYSDANLKKHRTSFPTMQSRKVDGITKHGEVVYSVPGHGMIH